MAPEVKVTDLGLIDYQQAWDYQEKVFNELVNQKLRFRAEPDSKRTVPHSLLICEHPHVFTLGKSGSSDNVLFDEDKRKEEGIQYYHINRGGDITYHGPGQLVAYPILDLDDFFTDIHKYLRFLEETIIRLCADYGLIANRYPGYTGVWLDPDNEFNARKICAMGVRCSRWVTMHGLALNVNTDLSYFQGIVPCGIREKKVTSLQAELQRNIPMEEVKSKFVDLFLNQFNAIKYEQNSLV